MDEQHPRLGGEQIRGRADADLPYERPTRVRRAGAAGETAEPQKPGRSTPGARDRGSDMERTTADDPEERTQEIRDEIERTRGDMSETVNAIQERLRPSAIAADAVERVKGAAIDTARDVAESEPVMFVRANPIPTAMVGIGMAGLAWLAMGGTRDHASAGGGSRQKRRDWRAPLSPDANAYTRGDRVSHGAAGPVDEGHTFAQSGRNQLLRTWNESPLLIGAASAVLGAVVAFALPETEGENRLMGETRDNVIETAQEKVRDTVNQVQAAATDAVGTMQEAAKSAAGLTSPTPSKA